MSLAQQIAATLDPASFAQWASAGSWQPAPHLELLNRSLLDVAAGKTRRLLVSMPPRHGKSELVSAAFPAWWLGKRPDDRVILASYEADFASSWGRRVRDLLDEHGPTLFGVKVRPDSSAVNRFDIDGRRGGMITAGVGGAITGRGAHLLIIDDPVKSAEDAQSEALSRRLWDWYRSTARTRLEPGGAVVVVMTRWHEADLAGRLLAEDDGEAWEVLNLPAVAESCDLMGRQPGEALWPERYTVADLEAARRALGSYLFAALYQGHPAPLDGNVFKRSWFRYWTPADTGYQLDAGVLISRNACTRFVTVDLAVSMRDTADYTVIATWARTKDNDLILLDRIRRRIPAPEQVPLLRKIADEWQPAWIGIESVAYQLAIVQAARRDGLPVRELKPDRDKVSRALIAAARLEAGTVYFPRKAPWLDELETELLLFPNGRHDDQVDTLAYAATELLRKPRPDLSGWRDPFARVSPNRPG